MLATVGGEHRGEPLVVSVLTCGIPALIRVIHLPG
jgi:hypothetical protein